MVVELIVLGAGVFKKMYNRHPEKTAYQPKLAAGNTVVSRFVFLQLFDADADAGSQLFKRNPVVSAVMGNLPADVAVDGGWGNLHGVVFLFVQDIHWNYPLLLKQSAGKEKQFCRCFKSGRKPHSPCFWEKAAGKLTNHIC